ncbi:dihydroorotate dehydrogenase electron transfer subunit [Tindallia magadiensis]|uniref:Dihydroorotate dehydrogenase B (NAD(+)), electron transfer subunit n=1 Tax=Tindallia magadiensis TaxID=69895 RepID=A0A1I3HIZ8_9FIRM|nr:dihydroorotate dehydrogenase electron transfer subunit [Tindallia magadiensis]SFI35631.1 dihydroorotate dehydrogenase electron transfer subunit [Tindallia magadiensis]
MKRMIRASIGRHEKIGENCWSMWLKAPGITEDVIPGQFAHIKLNQGEKLLPRPLSICEIDRNQKALRIVYAVVGSGTKDLSRMKSGEEVTLLSPLGNGYDIKATAHKSIIVGGGMGIPPLLELSKQIPGEKEIYLGYASTPFLQKDFEKHSDELRIATDDGSYGYTGTVLDAMNYYHADGDVLYSCGPRPMLQKISEWAKQKGIPAQISLEERMACGIGACLVCTCKIKKEKEEDWQYQRVCSDGPVFNSQEVVWDA